MYGSFLLAPACGWAHPHRFWKFESCLAIRKARVNGSSFALRHAPSFDCLNTMPKSTQIASFSISPPTSHLHLYHGLSGTVLSIAMKRFTRRREKIYPSFTTAIVRYWLYLRFTFNTVGTSPSSPLVTAADTNMTVRG